MSRTGVPTAVLLVALLAAGGSRGQDGPAGEGRRELREALREYYLHVLTEELELDAAQATTVAPLANDVLETQRAATQARHRALRQLRRARVAGTGDSQLRELVRRHSEIEREGLARVAEARAALVRAVSPRQGAQFLAFQDRFRARVRSVLRERRGGGTAGDDGDHPTRPGDAGPARPGGPQTDWRTDDRRGRVGDATAWERRETDAAETLRLLFVHEARQELGWENERLLVALPALESLFETRLASRREQGRVQRALRDALRSEGPDVEAVVARALEHEAALPDRLSRARQRLLEATTGGEAADLLLFEQRFEQQLPRRLRQLNGMQRRAPDRPRPGPGSRRRPGRR